MPTQNITTDSAVTVIPGGLVDLDLVYNTSNGSKVTGLTFEAYYNSSLLTPDGGDEDGKGWTKNTAINDPDIYVVTVINDTSNSDGDALTDKYVQVSNINIFAANWPSVSLPATLGELSFQSASDWGSSTDSNINIRASSTANGYTFVDYSTKVNLDNPFLTSSIPTDNATAVAVNSNIVLTFSEAVDVESGNIVIKKTADDSTVETIDVTSGQVTGTGTNQIKINPASDLAKDTEYYVQIAATALDDPSSNSYAGITDTTSLSFDTFHTGSTGKDTITGDNNANEIYGLAGNDLLYGRLGDDLINGGSGRDTAKFSSKNNRINLNTTSWQNTRDGRDRLISIENVNAGSGDDIVKGNRSSNTLNGQNGKDKLYGKGGNDVLSGGKGNDRLYGDGGKDRLTGGSGNDRLYGGSGKDRLTGGSGKDRLYGGSGNDVLIGGGGKDRVWGQRGRDTFRVERGDGYMIIEDFTNGQDKIQLGSGSSGLKLKTRGDDVLLYQRGDLMAIVEDSAGDLQQRGDYLV